MPYQSFLNQKGDSHSAKKLKALRLPKDLRGKSVLDVGCNEGFFCIKAKKRGAERVVGIDKLQDRIEAARRRAPRIDFRCQTWDTLPEGPFDVILLLSALHYAKDQKALLDRIYEALAPDGLFILETGISPSASMRWEQAQRPVGAVWYPSRSLLENRLLDKYAVRRVAESVAQRGDPFPRHVFHCRKFKPIIVLVTGKAKLGKSTLAGEFKKHQITTFMSDKFIREMATNQGEVSSEVYRFVQKNFHPRSIDVLTQKLIKKNLHAAFVEELVQSLPTGERILILEGYSLGLPEIKPILVRSLVNTGYRVWETERNGG